MSKRFIQITDHEGRIHVRPFDDIALTDIADIMEGHGIVRLENGQTFLVKEDELLRINALLLGDTPAPVPTPAEPAETQQDWNSAFRSNLTNWAAIYHELCERPTANKEEKELKAYQALVEFIRDYNVPALPVEPDINEIKRYLKFFAIEDCAAPKEVVRSVDMTSIAETLIELCTGNPVTTK